MCWAEPFVSPLLACAIPCSLSWSLSESLNRALLLKVDVSEGVLQPLAGPLLGLRYHTLSSFHECQPSGFSFSMVSGGSVFLREVDLEGAVLSSCLAFTVVCDAVFFLLSFNESVSLCSFNCYSLRDSLLLDPCFSRR